MFERPTITFTVRDGKVTAEVDGVKGDACTEMTRELFARLGQVTSSELKPEAYARENETHVRSRS